MSTETIERDFKQKVCAEIELLPEGLQRYQVLTPFTFPDGDHLVVVLKRDGERWLLSDEGHTFMHLTYSLDERDLQQGTRQRVIGDALSAFSITDRDGELVLSVPEEQFGNTLYSFVQGLMKITDVSYLSREQVRSTFFEDVRRFLAEQVQISEVAVNWHDAQHDPQGRYPVDFRLNGSARPTFVYALTNDDRVRDATISLLQYERWGLSARSIGIFQDEEEIGRNVLARFGDVCEKLFSNLPGNQDRIAKYLSEQSAA